MYMFSYSIQGLIRLLIYMILVMNIYKVLWKIVWIIIMKVYIYISRFLILLYYGVYGSNMYMYVYYLKKNEMFLYFR